MTPPLICHPVFEKRTNKYKKEQIRRGRPVGGDRQNMAEYGKNQVSRKKIPHGSAALCFIAFADVIKTEIGDSPL